MKVSSSVNLRVTLLVAVITLCPGLLIIQDAIANTEVRQDRAAEADRYYQLGIEFFEKQKFQSAISILQKALETGV
jgi:Tfp pilus assembly protein PilF